MGRNKAFPRGWRLRAPARRDTSAPARDIPARGCSSMVEQQPSKLNTRVRFPSPAPSWPNCCLYRSKADELLPFAFRSKMALRYHRKVPVGRTLKREFSVFPMGLDASLLAHDFQHLGPILFHAVIFEKRTYRQTKNPRDKKVR